MERGRKRLIEREGGRKGQVKEEEEGGMDGWREVRNGESEGQKINYGGEEMEG